MSDDDRMDRAERIRRMNEGRASGEAEEAAESGGGPTDEPADESGDAAAPDGADASTDGEADPELGEDGSEDAPAVDVAGDDGSEDAPAGQVDDDATATALRAAQASASVDGGVELSGGSAAESSPAATVGGDAATPADDADGDVAGVGGPAAAAATADAGTEETVRVLEFVVGDQAFCLDIESVEEIVEHESVTRVPNAPDCVSGVVDLRGQITTILDPRTFLDAEGGVDPSLIVVFDPVAFESHGAIGWLVDEVSRVASVSESAVTDAPGDDDHVEGVLDRDDEDDLVVWIDPHEALELVAGEDAAADG